MIPIPSRTPSRRRSNSVERLETRLETTLFERSSRRVQLSLAGAALLEDAQRNARNESRAEDDA